MTCATGQFYDFSTAGTKLFGKNGSIWELAIVVNIEKIFNHKQHCSFVCEKY